MPWVIVFVYSWILFLVFIDTKRFRISVYGGIMAALLGTVVDWGGQHYSLYCFDGRQAVNETIITFLHAAGPMFTMGTLFFQYLNRDRRVQVANVAAFSLAYLAVEFLIVSYSGARYIHWHYTASLTVDLLVFTAMSYVGEMVMFGGPGLKNKEGRDQY